MFAPAKRPALPVGKSLASVAEKDLRRWVERLAVPRHYELEQEENRAEADYEQLMARLTDPADRRIAEEAMYEERDHAVVLRTLAGRKRQRRRWSGWRSGR